MKNAPVPIAALMETARQAALEAGNAIMQIYRSGCFHIATKADDSPLTKADQAAHSIIVKHLQATGLPVLSEEGKNTPYQERSQWEWFWLVDPLDGTKEFIKRNGEFAVNIALMHQCEPAGGVVYAPSLNILYYGCEATGVIKETGSSKITLCPEPRKKSFDAFLGQAEVAVVASRSHLDDKTKRFINQFSQVRFKTMGSSLKLMLLAENRADLYPRFAPTMEWDIAAGHAILKVLNKAVYQPDLKTELYYNKPELLNTALIAF